MKHLYTLALFTLLAATAQAQVSTVEDSTDTKAGYSLELDKRHGFLGVKLDSPLSGFKDLQFIQNKDGEAVYRRRVERKGIGEATIKTVDYYFYKERLSAIKVRATNTMQNEKAWMELLKTAYQVSPVAVTDENDGHIDGTYLWHGERTGANYSVYTGSDISIYIGCSDIRTEKARDRASRLKRAAEKL